MISDLSSIFDTDNLDSVSPTVTTGCGLQNTSRGVRSSLLYSALTGDTDLSLSLENAAVTESINVEGQPSSSPAPQQQPKRVRIFTGGYISTEEYTYVHGLNMYWLNKVLTILHQLLYSIPLILKMLLNNTTYYRKHIWNLFYLFFYVIGRGCTSWVRWRVVAWVFRVCTSTGNN